MTTASSPGDPDSSDEPAATWARYVASGGRATGSGNRSTLPSPAPAASPTTACGRPSSARGGVEVPRRDVGTDLGAAHGTPIDLERRHHDDVEAATGPQRRERLGRPGPLVAEGGVGRHQEAVEARAGGDPRRRRRRTGSRAAARSKWTTTVVPTPAAARRVQALVRIAQERRGAAGQHLVRVMVERDHDRLAPTGGPPRPRGDRGGRRGRGGGRRTRRPRRTRVATRARSRRGPVTTRIQAPSATGSGALSVGRRAAEVGSPAARRAPCADGGRRRPPGTPRRPARPGRRRARSGRRGSGAASWGR